MNNRILVITVSGEVFAHEISGSNIGIPFQMGGAKVGSNEQDKALFVMQNRILVLTKNGDVFVHEVSGNNIGIPFQLSGPKVAANPHDKWVLTLNDRILVITNTGETFVHEVSGNNIGVPFKLSGAMVGANPQDKYVLALNDRILVITKGGEVFVHDVSNNTIGNPYQLGGPGVAANPQDKFVLTMDNKVLVITQDNWNYFAGLDPNNKPVWSPDEFYAVPLLPFGSSPFGSDHHKCFGYFSVRFAESLRKWIMTYTCGEGEGYNPNNGPRGVYLRMADLPWGPWSDPVLIFEPGTHGYCYFMHNQRAETNDECKNKGTNPSEESVRKEIRDPVTKKVIASEKGWGGEYAPLLLPSRYIKAEGDKTTLYYLMSTWNPYQVVLMRTIINGRL